MRKIPWRLYVTLGDVAAFNCLNNNKDRDILSLYEMKVVIEEALRSRFAHEREGADYARA